MYTPIHGLKMGMDTFVEVSKTCESLLTLKSLQGGGGQFDPPPCCFSKTFISKEWKEPWFFVTFNIIIGHFFRNISLKPLKLFEINKYTPPQY